MFYSFIQSKYFLLSDSTVFFYFRNWSEFYSILAYPVILFRLACQLITFCAATDFSFTVQCCITGIPRPFLAAAFAAFHSAVCWGKIMVFVGVFTDLFTAHLFLKMPFPFVFSLHPWLWCDIIVFFDLNENWYDCNWYNRPTPPLPPPPPPPHPPHTHTHTFQHGSILNQLDL